jgi:hypothetical protein
MPEILFEQIVCLVAVVTVCVCAVIYVDGRWGR